MNKSTIITIAGKLGSGKSTTALRVAEKLNYTHKSTGDFMRSLAKERNITLQELNSLAENDSSIDKKLDDFNRDLAKEENIILDSRLGFHFIPNSFKVFLEINSEIAAKRILIDQEKNTNRKNESLVIFDSVEKVTQSINNRLLSEKKRYKEIYGIENHTSHENFDLIIDTGTEKYNNNREIVVNEIIDKYKEWLNK